MRTVGSTFSGVGGFELGLARAGFRVAYQAEADPFCQRVLERRFPGVRRFADVRHVAAEPVDLLVGGFPCQGASVAGKRRGLADDRTALFWEIIRVQKIVKAPWALLENVPGLRSVGLGHDFPTVLAALAECWPAVGWRTLDSRFFNVAQQRERVFFVCGPTEAGVAEVLALTEGGDGDLAAGGEAGADVTHAISAGAGGSKFGSGRDGQADFVVTPINEQIATRHNSLGERTGLGVGTPGDPAYTLQGAHSHYVAQTLSAGSNPNSNMAGRRREDDVNLVVDEPWTLASRGRGDSHQLEFRQDGLANAILTPNGGRGGIGVGAVATTHALTGEGHDASEDGTGRGTPIVAFDTTQITSRLNRNNPKPGDPCHPLAAGAHAPAIAGSAVRRLTPLECERLQGFPDGWTCLCQPIEAYRLEPEEAALACTCPDGPRYRAMGNAVTVPVVAWLARRIWAAMESVA